MGRCYIQILDTPDSGSLLMIKTARFRAFMALLVALAAAAAPAPAQNVQRGIGSKIMMAGNHCPHDSTLARGQLLVITSNQYLYALIGHQFGGDGATFALPDWRGGPITQCIQIDHSVAPLYIGEVFEAGGTCPQGSIAADGRAVSTSDHPALWDLIGTRYGGDGRTYINLPNLNQGGAFYCVSAVGDWPEPGF
jgi:microcystin-dependent protein